MKPQDSIDGDVADSISDQIAWRDYWSVKRLRREPGEACFSERQLDCPVRWALGTHLCVISCQEREVIPLAIR